MLIMKSRYNRWHTSEQTGHETCLRPHLFSWSSIWSRGKDCMREERISYSQFFTAYQLTPFKRAFDTSFYTLRQLMMVKRQLRKLHSTLTSQQLMCYVMMFLLSRFRKTLSEKEKYYLSRLLYFTCKIQGGLSYLQMGHLKVLWAQCLSCISNLNCGIILPQYEHCSWPGGIMGRASPPSVGSSSSSPSNELIPLLSVVDLSTWPTGKREI